MTDNAANTFPWGDLTTHIPPEGRVVDGEAAVSSAAVPVVALGETGLTAANEATVATAEVSGDVRHVVNTAENRYRSNVASVVFALKGNAANAAIGLDSVGTRVETVSVEIPAARRALDAIDRFLTTGDLSAPAPEEVEFATRTLFPLGGVYEDAVRRYKDDYGDHFTDVRNVYQGLSEANGEAELARIALDQEANGHNNASPEALYLKEHSILLKADRDNAAHGAKLAGDVLDAMDGSKVLANLPEGPETTSCMQYLLNDIRAVGYEGISPDQLRSDFAQVVSRVDEIERAGGLVTAEVAQLKITLGTIEGIVGQLAESPVLSDS